MNAPRTGERVVFHNVWTSATFTVVGKEAIERMDALATWSRERAEIERERPEVAARERLFLQ